MNYFIKKFKLFYYDWNLDLVLTMASSPKTKEATLRILSESKWNSVRLRVAKNPATPSNILEVLANDDCPLTVVFAAENPNTPVKTLERLAFHPKFPGSFLSTYLAVMRNPNCPNYIKKYIKIQYHMTLINLSIRTF